MSGEATGGLADAVTGVFVHGRLDAAADPSAPTPGWRGMPEAAAEALTARAVIGSDRFWIVA